MSEDSELQAKIAAIAGRINRHKAQETSDTPQKQEHGAPSYGHRHWMPQRGTPYGVPRGRARGRAYRGATHSNRTLVLNASSRNSGTEAGEVNNAPAAVSTATGDENNSWVSQRGRHMQLINNSVYEKKASEKVQAMEETRKQKERAREEKEKSKIQRHLQLLQNQNAAAPTNIPGQRATPELFVKDVRFIVADNGSKLVKASGDFESLFLLQAYLSSNSFPDDANRAKPTPKTTHVGGVTFIRSKHGNMYRAGLVRNKRSEGPRLNNGLWNTHLSHHLRNRDGIKKSTELCPQFSTTGSCSHGPLCRYTHDPTKTAICRDFLQTGKCPSGTSCDLSHDPTPSRVPACHHFLRGNCTAEDACRYAHVRVSPAAPVCRAFAVLGYCDKGADCAERHVHECPDYANKQFCRNKKCRLPHVDRAGQLRKSAAKSANDGEAAEAAASADDDGSSDVESDDEELGDSDDVDSDDMEDEVVLPDEDTRQLGEQRDFVQL
ncbi:MAG: hypothetical protein M1831_002843 [Alyxoria varia]|nr:MAG: hypothetical protein M1831_002843 [Alyxoria varia]